MRKSTSEIFVNVIIAVLQFALTFVLTFSIYMILTIEQNFEGGLDNIVGLAIFQPIMGAIICAVTIFACFVVGLPIRFVTPISKWWSNNFAIAIIGIVFGIILITLSLIPSFRETEKVTTDGIDSVKEIPNTVLSITGWFITAFFALHVYPPKFIRSIMDRFAMKLFPQAIRTSLSDATNKIV